MKTIEELYDIAEYTLDGFGEGRYALEYHDVEEDDGIDMVVEVEEDDIR